VNRADDKFCGGCAKVLRPSSGSLKPTIKPAIAETTPIDLRDVLADEVAIK
jgi:hypothetical protein